MVGFKESIIYMDGNTIDICYLADELKDVST